MVRRFDRASGIWDPAVRVGSGDDNHGGPALTIDPEKPNWLPSIERPYSPRPLTSPPAVIWTHGGPGIGLKEGPATEVQFYQPADSGLR